jgi:hypothetical protein
MNALFGRPTEDWRIRTIFRMIANARVRAHKTENREPSGSSNPPYPQRSIEGFRADKPPRNPKHRLRAANSPRSAQRGAKPVRLNWNGTRPGADHRIADPIAASKSLKSMGSKPRVARLLRAEPAAVERAS